MDDQKKEIEELKTYLTKVEVDFVNCKVLYDLKDEELRAKFPNQFDQLNNNTVVRKLIALLKIEKQSEIVKNKAKQDELKNIRIERLMSLAIKA